MALTRSPTQRDRIGRQGHRRQHDRADVAAPNANYFSDLSDPSAFIAPQHILKDTDPKSRRDDRVLDHEADRDRAYKFIKYKTDEYSQFEANPDYFMGAPKIKNIFVKRTPGRPGHSPGQVHSDKNRLTCCGGVTDGLAGVPERCSPPWISAHSSRSP